MTYANQTLSELLAFKDYLGGITDIENKILKKRLETTTVERLKDFDDGKPIETTPWKIIEEASTTSSSSNADNQQQVVDKGGPCKLPVD